MMEDLIGLLIFFVTFVIWIAQSVRQEKKKRQREIEQQLEGVETEDLPVPLPARPKSGTPPLQQWLERMLNNEEKPTPSHHTPVPTKTVLQKSQPTSKPASSRGKYRLPKSLEIDSNPPPPQARVRISDKRHPAFHHAERSRNDSGNRRKNTHTRSFPDLHPNPLANAYILSEVFQRPSRPRMYRFPLGPH